MPNADCQMPNKRPFHSAFGNRHSALNFAAVGRKPNSVSRRLAQGGGHFSGPAVASRLKQPTRGCAGNSRRVLGLNSPPIWPCCRWGLPCRPSHPGRGALLPHHFTLTGISPGGLLSVALSVGLLRLDVIKHRARRTRPRARSPAVRTFLTRKNPGAIAASAATGELYG